MGFKDWWNTPFFGSKALTGTPAVLETLSARQFNPYIPLGGTNLDYGRINSVYVEAQNATYGWMYLYQPSVRRVIDYIARNISQLGLKVFERIEDDAREHRGDHRAAALLRRPNNWTPGSQFIFELIVDFLIYDNAYALKFRNPTTGELDALVRIDPPAIGLVGRSYFSVDAYRIYRPDGTSLPDLPPEDIIHWRGFEPSDPRRGASKLETLKEVLAADLTSRKAVTEQFRAGLTAAGWIERPIEAPELTDDAFTRVRSGISNQFASSRREWPLLEEGMKFNQASITPEDAQYLQARAASVEEVCSQYGISIVPPKNEEERKQFYADVLPPYTDSLAAFFDLHILQVEFDAEDHYFEFGREKLMDEVYKTLTSASGRPVLLTDEARAKLDLPPVPTGDELVTPGNVSVGGKPSTGVMPIQDPNKPPQDGSHRTEDVPVPAGRSVNGHHKAAPLVPRRARADARRNRWAKDYEEVLTAHFKRQRDSVRGKSLSQRAALKALEEERWDRDLAVELKKVSGRHFSAEGDEAAFRLNISFDEGQGVNWMAAKARGSAEGINATTREHIEEKGVSDAFAYAIGTRAAASGKGYSTDIAGFANKAALQQAPDYDRRTVTIDGGECEVCAPYQGTWPVNELEAWPAYHANCGCIADPS